MIFHSYFPTNCEMALGGGVGWEGGGGRESVPRSPELNFAIGG